MRQDFYENLFPDERKYLFTPNVFLRQTLKQGFSTHGSFVARETLFCGPRTLSEIKRVL